MAKAAPKTQTPALDPETEELVEQVATEAKKTFSLKERIAGAKYGSAKVPIILDVEAAVKHTELNEQSKIMKKMYEAAAAAGQPQEEIDKHLRRFNEVDAARDAALQDLLKGMLSISLTGGPAVFSDIAARKAKKYLGLKSGTTLTDEQNEAWEDELRFRNFEITLLEIRDSSGAVAELVEDELRHFRNGLPATQRVALDKAVTRLIFTDAVATSAVDDPGF